MANRIRVNIAGEVFRLVADEDEAFVQRVVRYTDEMVRDARGMSGSNTFAVGVLAVMNTADAALKAQDELAELKQKYAKLEQVLLDTQEALDNVTDRAAQLQHEVDRKRKSRR